MSAIDLLPSSDVASSDDQTTAPSGPSDNFETPFAPLKPPFYWLQIGILTITGAFLGLLGLGYVKAITLGPQAWYQADGNSAYPDDPATLQYARGKVWWIGVGAATGLLTGILKVLWKIDEYPSFIVDLRDRHVDIPMSLKVFMLTLLSQIGGASMGPEAGIGAAGAVVGQLVAAFFKRFKHTKNIDSKVFVVAGMCGAFASIFPSPLLSLSLVAEIGVPLGCQNWNGASTMNVLTLFAVTSTFAYAVYFSLDTATYLDPKSMIYLGYETRKIQPYDFAIGILFGILGAVLSVLYCVCAGIVQGVISPLKQLLERHIGTQLRIITMCCIGGILYGVLMYVFPLTVGSGSALLGPVISASSSSEITLGSGLLTASTFAKFFAYWICRECGLVGGLVFPMMLSGLMMGVAFAQWTGVNIVLASSCGFISIVLGLIPAPFTFIILSFYCLVVGQQGLVPIFTCGFTAYLVCVGMGLPGKLMQMGKGRKSRF